MNNWKNRKKRLLLIVGLSFILLAATLTGCEDKKESANGDAGQVNQMIIDKAKEGHVLKGDKKNPFKKMEIETFDESEGIIVENCSEGSESIGGIKNGYYTIYYDVDFGDTGAAGAVFRGATPMVGGRIEIHIDSIDGTLIGSCEITKTGDWNEWANFACDLEQITGIHHVYLVYTGTDYLFNLNWFQFYKEGNKELKEVSINTAPPTVGNVIGATIEPWNGAVIYEWLVDGEVKGICDTYNVKVSDVDKKIQLRVTGVGDFGGVISSEETGSVLNIEYDLNFEDIAYQAFTSFINRYYTSYDGEGRIKGGGFWDLAEMYEIVIDAYVHTGDPRYKDMMDEIYNGFVKDHNKDWLNNDYNDDIMWMTIACARAYLATGDEKFLESAVYHFDAVFERGWSEDLGGGIFWRTDNQTKNACINCPATIAACLLGEALQDEAYYDKAKLIHKWVTSNLYEPDTGHVYDAYELSGAKNDWASTYNQGTFIGAATLLYEYTGEENYLNEALMAADYTINTMYSGGVMNNEDSNNDLIGFKGILTRWMNLLAINHNQPKLIEWLQVNAANAWSNRNSEGLMWTLFGNKTDDVTDYKVFGITSALALLQNCQTSTVLTRDAVEKNEIEDFDSCKGIIVEDCNEGGKSIGGVQDGYYTTYHNVDFGDGGITKANFRCGTPMDGGTIEFHIQGMNGPMIGICEITSTGDWGTWQTFRCDIEEVSGLQDICFVYKGDEWLFNVNWFQFE